MIPYTSGDMGIDNDSDDSSLRSTIRKLECKLLLAYDRITQLEQQLKECDPDYAVYLKLKEKFKE